MRHFKMNITRMFKIFGTQIKVWDISKKPDSDYWLGAPEDSREWIKQVEPEIRYEPVLPYSSSYQKYATSEVVNHGGTEEVYDLSLYSKGTFGRGSIVEVKGQSPNKFRVISLGNYHEFAGYTVYQLKGDGQHKDG